MAFGKSKVVTTQAPDILAQKKNCLDLYKSQFDRAVHTINDTIDNLGLISESINETMREIEDYEKELAATKSGLVETKERNDKVIANFKSLLCVE